jgi:hypothetical protein
MSAAGPHAGEQPQERSDSQEVPPWALTYAQAARGCGQKVAEIEMALVSNGLTPRLAAVAIDRCFDSRFAAEPSPRRALWVKWLNRGASLAVAAFVVALASSKGGAEGAIRSAISLLLPLACIWFSETFGSYVGPSYSAGMGYVNRPTPGVFVAIGGWLLLGTVALLWMLFG